MGAQAQSSLGTRVAGLTQGHWGPCVLGELLGDLVAQGPVPPTPAAASGAGQGRWMSSGPPRGIPGCSFPAPAFLSPSFPLAAWSRSILGLWFSLV